MKENHDPSMLAPSTAASESLSRARRIVTEVQSVTSKRNEWLDCMSPQSENISASAFSFSTNDDSSVPDPDAVTNAALIIDSLVLSPRHRPLSPTSAVLRSPRSQSVQNSKFKTSLANARHAMLTSPVANHGLRSTRSTAKKFSFAKDKEEGHSNVDISNGVRPARESQTAVGDTDGPAAEERTKPVKTDQRKGVHYYAILTQIQKIVRSENASTSLGKVLSDASKRGVSLDTVTEMYKQERIKAKAQKSLVVEAEDGKASLDAIASSEDLVKDVDEEPKVNQENGDENEDEGPFNQLEHDSLTKFIDDTVELSLQIEQTESLYDESPATSVAESTIVSEEIGASSYVTEMKSKLAKKARPKSDKKPSTLDSQTYDKLMEGIIPKIKAGAGLSEILADAKRNGLPTNQLVQIYKKERLSLETGVSAKVSLNSREDKSTKSDVATGTGKPNAANASKVVTVETVGEMEELNDIVSKKLVDSAMPKKASIKVSMEAGTPKAQNKRSTAIKAKSSKNAKLERVNKIIKREKDSDLVVKSAHRAAESNELDEKYGAAANRASKNKHSAASKNKHSAGSAAESSEENPRPIPSLGLDEKQLRQMKQFVKTTEELNEDTEMTSEDCIDCAIKQNLQQASLVLQHAGLVTPMSSGEVDVNDIKEVDKFFAKFHLDDEIVASSSDPDAPGEAVVEGESRGQESPMTGSSAGAGCDRVLSETVSVEESGIECISTEIGSLTIQSKNSELLQDVKPEEIPSIAIDTSETGQMSSGRDYHRDRQYTLPIDERTVGHQGYRKIDFYSLYESTLVNVQDEDIDRAPWEYRGVGQRFLGEKSVESRNWFGSIVAERGNDRIPNPICRPRSFQVRATKIADPDEWNEDWFTTWKSRRDNPNNLLTYAKEDEVSTTKRGASDDGTVETHDSDAESDVTEDKPRVKKVIEIGNIVSVRVRCGERVSRIHPDFTSSLRMSRWKRKYCVSKFSN